MKKRNQKKLSKPDIINKFTGKSWVYSRIVKKHFFHPQNLLLKDPKPKEFDAEGVFGSPACGDVMRVWLKIDSKKDKITDFKWRTFGCASAIAATSMFSVMVTEKGGITIDNALKIKPQDITKRLGGLPDRKLHCSVLVDSAFQVAVDDWRKKGRNDKI